MQRRWQPRRKLRSKPGQRGSALIEFLLIAMFFFFLLFAIIDFSWMMFANLNLQDAVREAGRYASTGNHLSSPTNPGVTMSRTDSIQQVLYRYVEAAHVDNIAISSAVGGTGSAGGPGDTVTIKVTANVPFLTKAIGTLFGSDNKYHFTVTSSFRNEPFSPSDTK